MRDKNTSHLAGEFLVAGELSRREYPVAITFGNAKSVDIYADTSSGTIKIDAKAGRTSSNWPMDKKTVKTDTYYIFVYLQTQKKINSNVCPEYFVVSGREILTKNLITRWKKRQGITYQTLNNHGYKGRWDKLPQPYTGKKNWRTKPVRKND